MKLLTLKESAEMMTIPIRTARQLLKKIPCIDYGRGRGKGVRYLESDIEQLIMDMRKVSEVPAKPVKAQTLRLKDLSVSDLFELTHKGVIQ